MKLALMILSCIFLPAASCFAAPEWTLLQVSLATPYQVFGEDTDVHGLRLSLFHARNENMRGIDLGVTASVVKKDCAGIQFASFGTVHGSLTGLQVSPFWNWVDKEMYGIQASAVGVNYAGSGGGLQVALAMNMASTGKGEMFYGAQICPFMFNTGNVTGLQIAAMANGIWAASTRTSPYTRSVSGGTDAGMMNGLQAAGFMNLADTARGIQVSALGNKAFAMRGAQLCGIANRAAEEMTGLQIAAVNSSSQMRGVQIGIINYSYRMTGVQVGLVNIIHRGAVPVLPIVNFSATYDLR